MDGALMGVGHFKIFFYESSPTKRSIFRIAKKPKLKKKIIIKKICQISY
jgi:hypothetical protein